IDKADAVIDVTPYHVTYDGDPHTASGTASGVESPTPADLTPLLHLGGTSHTDAGDYTDDAWSFEGNTNYKASAGTVHDQIDKAGSTTTVTCPAGPYTYDGTAQTPCSAAVAGAGGLDQPLGVDYSDNVHAG